MTVAEWLRGGTLALRQAGLDNARLDCLVLLEDQTGHDRAWLLAHDEISLPPEQLRPLQAALNRRVTHEPLAYIRGFVEFYGHRFTVNSDVLVPRPETETLLDLAGTLRPERALDLGSGSGCLGISLKLARPELDVTLSDNQPAALAVAAANARRLGAMVRIVQADLLDGLDDRFDLILANLPYVPTAYPVNRAARHEPASALYSGRDGLDHYRRLWARLNDRPVRYVITEALPAQHAGLRDLATAAGYRLGRTAGYAQLFSSDG